MSSISEGFGERVSGRTCGECIACCVYLRVNQPEFKKKGLTHCQHLCLTNPVEPNVLQYSTDEPKACGLHGTPERHKICDTYLCEWRRGYGAEQDRPDRCGMLIDRVHGIDNAIECKPLWVEAAESEAGLGAALRISRGTGSVALVAKFGERNGFARVLGRPL